MIPTQEPIPHLLHWQADSLPLSHQGSSNVITGTLKVGAETEVEAERDLAVDEEVILHEKDVDRCCWLWRWAKRPQANECGQFVETGKSKKEKAPKEMPSTNTLIYPTQRDLCWTCNSQSCEITLLCHLSPLHFWLFVTPAIENNTRPPLKGKKTNKSP